MSYDDVVEMASNNDFILRVAAAAAKVDLSLENPVDWARNYVWHVSSLEDLDRGWATARQEARDGNSYNPNPAKRSDLLADAALDRAVTRVLNANKAKNLPNGKSSDDQGNDNDAPV